MALSEEEQRMLEQLEASLSREDPRLASTLRGTRGSSIEPRRILIGAAGFIAGLALLVGGMAWKWPLSLVGFAVMLAAAYFVIAGRQDPHQRFEVPDGRQRSGAKVRAGNPRGRGRSTRTGMSGTVTGGAHRSGSSRASGRTGSGRTGSGRSGSGDQAFMDRLEERWKRRQDGR